MTAAHAPQLQAARRVSRDIASMRARLRELERRRDEVIATLRRHGVGTSEIAAACGLSPGRVTQICNRAH